MCLHAWGIDEREVCSFGVASCLFEYAFCLLFMGCSVHTTIIRSMGSTLCVSLILGLSCARASPGGSLLEQLERAHVLHQAGALTAAEYKQLKGQLLQDATRAQDGTRAVAQDGTRAHEGTRAMAGSQRFFGKGVPDGMMPPGQEYELMTYNVTGTAGASITQFQLYGTGDPLATSGFNDTRIRYYIDGEDAASIDVLLYLAHGMGAQGRVRAPRGSNHRSPERASSADCTFEPIPVLYSLSTLHGAPDASGRPLAIDRACTTRYACPSLAPSASPPSSHPE